MMRTQARRPRATLLGLIAAGSLAACEGSQRADQPWHAAAPRVTVTLGADAEALIVLDTVRAWPAPEIQMDAVVRHDRKHRQVIAAPQAGTLHGVRDSAHVRGGDTLAVIVSDSTGRRRQRVVRSPFDGTWTPGRRNAQQLLDGDTIGFVGQDGFWWAVGTISDGDSKYVHPGDPARVVVEHRRAVAGRIEWVEPPTASRYWAEVAVEFAAPEAAFLPGALATTTVAPAHLRDSVPVVPVSAVVHFRQGAALFARVRPREYELRWVTVGPETAGRVPVRGDVIPGSLVVARGLATLAGLARDSLGRPSS